MLDGSAVGLSSLSSRTKWQQLLAGDTLRSVYINTCLLYFLQFDSSVFSCSLCSLSPAGNRCHFVLLDNDESCPTADLSNIGRPNGPAYSTGELLNTPQVARYRPALLSTESRTVADVPAVSAPSNGDDAHVQV